jgi:hypothetical protein
LHISWLISRTWNNWRLVLTAKVVDAKSLKFFVSPNFVHCSVVYTNFCDRLWVRIKNIYINLFLINLILKIK